MQDTTTQAMTELALGLSMAFFSIMILALLSMNQSVAVNGKLDVLEDKSFSYTGKVKAEQEPEIIFFFNNHFYWQSLQLVDIAELDKTKALVIAVESNMSLLRAIKLKSRINHPQLSLTTINSEWLQQLKQSQG